MPHYRTMLSSTNFSAADLWSESGQRYGTIVVSFESFKKGTVVGEGGRSKDMPFATMRSQRTGELIPKPLGLNATNCKTLSSLTGSENVDKWIGPLFQLVVVDTTVGRERVKAIRIAPEIMKASDFPAPAGEAKP